MIKFSQADYSNLKLVLLYLVVYGHWIETRISDSKILLEQYRLNYLIHMPLFVFLSGLFLRNQEDCLRQIKRLLPVYGVMQVVVVVLSGGTVKIWTPFWHLWYLLSFCFWAGPGWLWFRFESRKWKWFIGFRFANDDSTQANAVHKSRSRYNAGIFNSCTGARSIA